MHRPQGESWQRNERATVVTLRVSETTGLTWFCLVRPHTRTHKHADNSHHSQHVLGCDVHMHRDVGQPLPHAHTYWAAAGQAAKAGKVTGVRASAFQAAPPQTAVAALCCVDSALGGRCTQDGMCALPCMYCSVLCYSHHLFHSYVHHMAGNCCASPDKRHCCKLDQNLACRWGLGLKVRGCADGQIRMSFFVVGDNRLENLVSISNSSS